jgi:RNA polymerase sigma-70 factor (ECF subfamily)
MHPADRECVERVQAGDGLALAELYDRFAALLHPLALRITGNPAEADEVLYETWLQVCRRSVPFDARRGSVASWLLSIVRTRALERVRSGASANAASGGGDGAIEITQERMELTDRAVEALGMLDDTERQVLEMAYFQGFTQAETAERLGVSPSDVRAWTRQGLDRLDAAAPVEEAA